MWAIWLQTGHEHKKNKHFSLVFSPFVLLLLFFRRAPLNMLSTYMALKLLGNSQECESFLNRQISMALLCFKTHNSQCTCMKITRQKCFCLWAAGSVSCVLAQCLVSSCNILVSVLLTAYAGFSVFVAMEMFKLELKRSSIIHLLRLFLKIKKRQNFDNTFVLPGLSLRLDLIEWGRPESRLAGDKMVPDYRGGACGSCLHGAMAVVVV